MTTMASHRASADHGNEIWLLELSLDQCTLNNKFLFAAEATCTATSVCKYTFATCRDTANYSKGTKVHQFCSRGARIAGAWPYLKPIKSILPTEIDPQKFKSKRGRMTFDLAGDTAHVFVDDDKSFDLAKQSSMEDAGLWWPNFWKRNPAYRGRLVELKFGYKGVPVANYELKFRGILDNVEYTRHGAKITALDLLWSAVFADTPTKIATTITVNDNPLGSGDVTLTLDNNGVTNFTASDHFETPDYNSGASTINQYRYIKIEDEIIAYTGITDGAGAALTGLVRGVMETTAAAHAQATEINAVSYYAATDAVTTFDNLEGLPPDHLFMDMVHNLGGISADYAQIWTTGISTQIDGNQGSTATTITVSDITDLPGEGVVQVNSAELIRYTGISGATLTGCLRGCYGTTAAALTDNYTVYPTSFTQWFGNWTQGSRYKSRFESPGRVKDRINSLRCDTMMDMWINEDGNTEGRLTTWPAYGTEPTTFTDLDIIEGKRKVNRDEKIRITRVNVLGNPQSPDAGDSVSDYAGGIAEIYVDAVAESSDSFDEKRERTVFAPWIYRSNEARIRAAREFFVNREARSTFEFELEAKDEAQKTGDLIQLTLSEIVDEDGTADTRFYKIVKKTPMAMGRIKYKAKDIGFGDKRYCLISGDSDTYDATSADKNIYGWISDGNDQLGAANDNGFNIF